VDSLALIAVAADFDIALRDSHLADVRHEPPYRYRIVFALDERPRSLLVSLHPRGPWVGRPPRPSRKGDSAVDPFAAACGRALRGVTVADVRKARGDRRLEIHFTGGRTLVAELSPNLANLVLLAADGSIEASARHPKSARERLAVGVEYHPPPIPTGRGVPVEASAERLDAALGQASEDSVVEALRRRWFGLGRDAAEAVAVESARTGRSAGSVLAEHVACLRERTEAPVVETLDDVERALEEARFDPSRARLLPWDPPWPPEAGWTRTRGGSAAVTVGQFYEWRDRSEWRADRTAGCVAVLQRELRRWDATGRRVERDLASFEAPERFRIQGEALLAGLASARRRGEVVEVPNPYDADGAALHVPAAPGRALTSVADDLFGKHRRAVRGLEGARRRLQEVSARAATIARLLETAQGVNDAAGLERLEQAMREARLAVGLDATGPGRGPAMGGPRVAVRLEGVRMYQASDGTTILAGKNARDSERLTFRVASPEDFWLHVHEVPGAHVVMRNPERRRRPDPRALLEAAAIAAWHSDARSQPQVDVRWTRRKYVRRARGGTAGLVILKRFETVRVRPGLPAGPDEPL